MTEEFKEIDPKLPAVADADADADAESDEDVEETGETANAEGQAATKKKKKKKSKKKKVKDALTGGPTVEVSEADPTNAQLTDAQFQQLLHMNPSLKREVGGMDPEQVKELMKNMDLDTALSGLVYSAPSQSIIFFC